MSDSDSPESSAVSDSAVNAANFTGTLAAVTGPEGPFALVDSEVNGIPMRVYRDAPPSMRFVWELAAAHADKDYIVYEDERLTYAEADALVKQLAKVLHETHGVGRGDRVALAMRNYPEWVIGYWAITSIGAAVVGLNAWWTGPEMNYGLSDSRPKVLICDQERFDRVSGELEDLRSTAPLHVMTVRTDVDLPEDASRWEDAVGAVVAAGNSPTTLPDVTIEPDDDATIFYTSGTTGFPKGAQLTHRGSVHNLMNLIVMTTAASIAETGAPPEPDPDAPQNVFMAPTPLFHVTACNCILHPATATGSRIVLTYRFDPGGVRNVVG